MRCCGTASTNFRLAAGEGLALKALLGRQDPKDQRANQARKALKGRPEMTERPGQRVQPALKAQLARKAPREIRGIKARQDKTASLEPMG